MQIGDNVLFKMGDIAKRLGNLADPAPSLKVAWVDLLN
jgi:hypothetical protein